MTGKPRSGSPSSTLSLAFYIRNISDGGISGLSHQHIKFNELIRLLSFVALETVNIEIILEWGKRKG